MGTNVCIDSIQNNKLKTWALCVDAMGVGENDKYLDTQEWNVFLKGAIEDVQNKKCAQEDLDQVLGLYLSQSQNTNTPPKENGLVDNLKKYFCDDNGNFSALQTGKSMLEAGITVALLFTGFRAIKSLAKVVKNSKFLSKLMHKKPKIKPNAQHINPQAPSQTQSQTITNAVTNKTTPKTTNKTHNAPAKNTKNVETVPIKNGQKRITKDAHGRVSKVEILKGGKVTRQIRTDVNGKKITTDYVYRADGGVDKTIIKYERGAVDIARDGKNLSYPDGAIKEIKYENWQYTEVTKNLKEEHVGTNVYDAHNSLIKQIFAKPDSKGRIMIERQGANTIETYADGTSKILKPNVTVIHGPNVIN